MEYRTNCKHCGAPLHYDKTNYGKTAKCDYCRTEYHIDLLGRIEEYKVKLEVMGEIKEYYIGNLEMHPIFIDAFRGIDGTLIHSKPIYKTKIELIEI